MVRNAVSASCQGDPPAAEWSDGTQCPTGCNSGVVTELESRRRSDPSEFGIVGRPGMMRELGGVQFWNSQSRWAENTPIPIARAWPMSGSGAEMTSGFRPCACKLGKRIYVKNSYRKESNSQKVGDRTMTRQANSIGQQPTARRQSFSFLLHVFFCFQKLDIERSTRERSIQRVPSYFLRICPLAEIYFYLPAMQIEPSTEFGNFSM
jgi:hypothetical protein